ncbi:MAG: cell division protein SepF [Bacilli bacterium]|nr:cell division protein SepF [Bacilli bacterium]
MAKKHDLGKSPLTSFQLLERVIVSSFEQLLDLANLLKNGKPLLLSFQMVDVEVANKMIGFLSGVVYALEGSTHFTDEKTILFASKKNFEDGSLNQFIKERN